MSDCCKDNTCKPGTVAAPSACFDDCRLSISKDDFKKIDTNNSGALSGQELDQATGSGDFSGNKLKMVECIRDHVNNSKVDADFNGSSVKMAVTLPSWHGTDFAKQQLSNDDFKLIDGNGDNVLDSGDLKNAADAKLSKMSKHAASVLKEHLDASLDDPLLSLKGGVKNWHTVGEGDGASAAAGKLPGEAAKDGVPGLSIKIDEGVAVSKLDEKGRPTVIETVNGVHKITYDEKSRISEVSVKSDYMENDKPEIKQITYDDANNTQTISRIGDDGKPYSTTVNHIKDGKVFREDHSYDDSNNVTTLFDEQGRIKAQIENFRQGGRSESEVQYNANGERKSTTSIHFDEHGMIAQESSYDFATKTSTDKYFDAQGRVSRIVEGDNTVPKKPLIKEYSLDADGKPTGSIDVAFSDRPFLAGSITQRDAQWKMRQGGPIGQVESIQYKDANGEAKTLSAKSQGEDQKLFRQMQGKFHSKSHPPYTGNQVEEHSPGSWDQRIFSGAAC